MYTGDKAVMKIHKKTKIGIPEVGTFSVITSRYIELEAKLLRCYNEKIRTFL